MSPVSRPSSSGRCLWLPRKTQILFHLSAFPDLRPAGPWVKIAACLARSLLPVIKYLPLVLCSLRTLMRGSGVSHRVTSGGNLIPAGCCRVCVLHDRQNVCGQAPRGWVGVGEGGWEGMWSGGGSVIAHNQRILAQCSLLKNRGQRLQPSQDFQTHQSQPSTACSPRATFETD